MKKLNLPDRTNKKQPLLLNFNIIDIFFMVVYLFFTSIIVIVFYYSGIGWFPTLIIGLFLITILVFLSIDLQGTRIYKYCKYVSVFLMRKKHQKETTLKEALGVEFKEDCIYSSNGYSKIIEVTGLDLGLMQQDQQEEIIRELSKIIKSINGAKIIKMDKPLDLASYVNKAVERVEVLTNSTEANKSIYTNLLENQTDELYYNIAVEPKTVVAFYLVLYKSRINDLNEQAQYVKEKLNAIGLNSIIYDKEKNLEFYELFFNQIKNDDNDNILYNELKENVTKIKYGDTTYKLASFSKIPLFTDNAFLYRLFTFKDIKVSLNLQEKSDKQRVYKALNRNIASLKGDLSEAKISESKKIDLETTLHSYQTALETLKLDSEKLYTYEIIVMYPSELERKIKDIFNDADLGWEPLYFRQIEAFAGLLPHINSFKLNNLLHDNLSLSIAGMFPFISEGFQDKNGIYLGYNTTPFFFDRWYSWYNTGSTRTNANQVILGTSGMGKTFTARTIVTQELIFGTKCVILDPENEYYKYAKKFGGDIIDLGGLSKNNARINPLQAFIRMTDDESSDSVSGFNQITYHRQFLESFFSLTMSRLPDQDRPYLNDAIEKMYDKFKITDNTDIRKIPTNKWPIMSDLLLIVEEWIDEYDKINSSQRILTILDNIKYNLKAFAGSGMFAPLWNGTTTISIKNDLTVFSFANLGTGSNSSVRAGQMLLVMNFLNRELINNYMEVRNSKDSTKKVKHMLVFADEAHVFIDSQNPIALVNFKDMSKRCRKYAASFMLATQNIDDFLGKTEETKSLATAIINNMQYTTFLGLKPNDLNAVKDLFKSIGGLTENEITYITHAKQGDALMIIDNKKRVKVHIDIYENELDIINGGITNG